MTLFKYPNGKMSISYLKIQTMCRHHLYLYAEQHIFVIISSLMGGQKIFCSSEIYFHFLHTKTFLVCFFLTHSVSGKIKVNSVKAKYFESLKTDGMGVIIC